MGTRTGPGSRTAAYRLAAGLVVGFASVVIAVLPASVAGAATQSVTNCNDSGVGSLRQAVLNAASGDTITFALSPACSTITLTSGEIDISQSLTIDGPGAGALAVSGNDQSRVFAVISGTVAISGLTIENGDIPGNINSSGGGINNDGTLSVTNTVLLDNTVQGPGGGIYNDFGASLTVTDSTFLGDGGPIASGGAISNEGTAVTISGSSLVDNTADQGGGIWSQGPTITITNSSISDNTGGGISASGTLSLTDSTVSGNSGGGGVRDGGELTVTDSQVSDNSGTGISGDPLVLTGSTVSGNSGATDGGGIYARGTSSVTTSTISDNSASDGGGIYFDQGTLSVTNSTISGNFTALSHGGGDIADYSPGLSMAATIVASSPSGGDCSMPGYVTITDGGDNLDDDGSCGFTAGTDHPDTPAGLDPTGPESNGGPTQTVALEPGSAAIGAVHGASLCSMPDQRGVARSTPCDIGAFQSHFVVVTNCNNTGSGSLRQAASTAVFGDSISFALAPACSLITVGSPIDITATVGIDGPGAGVLAVSGSNAVGAFAVSSGVSATVSGLTIEDGKGVLPDGGGGILNSGTLTVENSALSGNTSSADGGGISNLGTLTVVDDTLTGNSTGTASGLDDTNGGGALFNDGLLTVVGSTLSNNAGAGGGGGIANDGGQVSVTGSTLSGNKSPGIAGASGSGRGGGIWTNGGTLGVADSTLSGNSASLDGGGVYDVGNGLASVSDTTVSGNSATHDGGGVMNGGSLWVIADST
ncbi:MAG TPA: right-handed parallel beta-helix repeat-containing protein, partial [Acidimicrobiales bacterium]